MSYKVGIKTTKDTDWVFNAFRFATDKAAREYGSRLAGRWSAVQRWDVFASDDPVNVGEEST